MYYTIIIQKQLLSDKASFIEFFYISYLNFFHIFSFTIGIGINWYISFADNKHFLISF